MLRPGDLLCEEMHTFLVSGAVLGTKYLSTL